MRLTIEGTLLFCFKAEHTWSGWRLGQPWPFFRLSRICVVGVRDVVEGAPGLEGLSREAVFLKRGTSRGSGHRALLF